MVKKKSVKRREVKKRKTMKKRSKKKLVKKNRVVKKTVVVSSLKYSGENKSKPSMNEIKKYHDIILEMRKEISKSVIGQEDTIESIIRALLCNGHVLLEGVPGIAKTLAIRTLAVVTGSDAKRIQFTVDLLPTDITGITTYSPVKGFETIKGPIFANFIIADEINRSPPKCVLGDTPIITGNGEISTIKEIIKRHNGKKTVRQGEEYWITPKTPLKLHAFDLKDYKIKPEEVKYLYKQKTREPYFEVKLKTGRKIKTSPIHPFFTFKNGKVENIQAKDLTEGECVLVPKKIPVNGNNELRYNKKALVKSKKIFEEIARRKDLYDNVMKLRKEGVRNKEIDKKLMLSKKDGILMRSFLVSKPKYFSYHKKENYFFPTSKQFGQVRAVRKLGKCTRELAQFIAILMAEGNVTGRSIYLTMKDKEIPSLFKKLIKDIFDVETRLLFDDKRKMYRIALSSNGIVETLKAVGYKTDRKAGNKEIPNFILSSSDNIVKEFLKMYYECDGSISRDCVKVTTKSKEIANSISYLLLRLGFVSKIGNELTKTKIGNYSYKRKFYNVRLYGPDLYDFSEKIDFFSKEKSKKLRGLTRGNEKKKSDLIPDMHNRIREIRKTEKLSHKEFFGLTGMHAHNLENPLNSLMHSRYRLKKLVNVISDFKERDDFIKLMKGDFYCDFVKEKREIRPKKDYWLYDFSMKNNHSFVAGFGGIIAHNTQSATIEAMQEKQVTIGKETFHLPNPFFVMATQNPLESSGVYSLPEAQVDRFIFKVIMGYPKTHEEEKVMEDNITLSKFEDFNLRAIIKPTDIVKMQNLTKRIYLSPRIKKYILDIVKKTRTKDFKYGELIEWGGSPRASISLFIASKARALMHGRNYVIPLDVKEVAHETLRHRIILSYRAKAEKIDTDKVISHIINREVQLS